MTPAENIECWKEIQSQFERLADQAAKLDADDLDGDVVRVLCRDGLPRQITRVVVAGQNYLDLLRRYRRAVTRRAAELSNER